MTINEQIDAVKIQKNLFMNVFLKIIRIYVKDIINIKTTPVLDPVIKIEIVDINIYI